MPAANFADFFDVDTLPFSIEKYESFLFSSPLSTWCLVSSSWRQVLGLQAGMQVAAQPEP
jgi:hypothetical protein